MIIKPYNNIHFVANTLSEIPAENINVGSVVYIIDESVNYMLNSNNEWIKIDYNPYEQEETYV